METVERAELERFRTIVCDLLRLQFDSGKMEFLGDALRQRLNARRMSAGAYLAEMGSGNAREELRALASQLTVTETYFFRTPDHFGALARVALPERIREASARRRLRLLSAGCASGEEPYSLAMTLREQFPEVAGWDIKILGLDINPAMLAKAREASYSTWSLRQTPAEIRNKYFAVEAKSLVLDPSVRSMVTFEERNLALEDARFWSREPFDIIFCCNVIMYLIPDAVRTVVAQLTRALSPAGFLFLSHAETLRGLSEDFHLRHTDDMFYYQKRGATEEPVLFPRPAMEFPQPALPADLDGTPWVDAIRTASERIQSLSRQPGARSGPLPAVSSNGQRPPAELGLALELLRQEKFQEALGGLPVTSHRDTQLLRAVLLTNSGDLKAAEAICRELLFLDDLNTSAHYLTALCREHAGDMGAAMEHDRAAIYLDPAFAMPHLHLGLLAKRSGDLVTASRELQRAGELLPCEDSFRILLLGGGFGREAMVEFSRAQLRACGGSR
jgi:chemotaxis protein methyltransferase CheR